MAESSDATCNYQPGSHAATRVNELSKDGSDNKQLADPVAIDEVLGLITARGGLSRRCIDGARPNEFAPQ